MKKDEIKTEEQKAYQETLRKIGDAYLRQIIMKVSYEKEGTSEPTFTMKIDKIKLEKLVLEVANMHGNVATSLREDIISAVIYEITPGLKDFLRF